MEGRRDPLADSQLAALDRLLEQAGKQDDPRARSDAIEAVVQRTVFVCTIPGTQPPEPRVLINSKGEVGLPMYTRLTSLEEGARMYGWANPDGQVEHLEMGARQAFQFARDRAIQAVVIDCGLEHAIELGPAEWPQPALMRRASSSGQAASLRSSSTTAMRAPALQAAAPSSRPPPATGSSPGTVPAVPSADPLRDSSISGPHAADPLAATGSQLSASGPQLSQSGTGYAAIGGGSLAQTGSNLVAQRAFGSVGSSPGSGAYPSTTTRAVAVGGTMTVETDAGAFQITRPRVAPSDAQKDGLADVLRNFPEVEWASFLAIGVGDDEPGIGVGLRVDSALRTRLPEIEAAIREAGQRLGIVGSVPVLWLDRPDVMRFVRSAGMPFFPWKK